MSWLINPLNAKRLPNYFHGHQGCTIVVKVKWQVVRDSYQSISTIIPPTGILEQAKPGAIWPFVLSRELSGNRNYITEKTGTQPQLHSF